MSPVTARLGTMFAPQRPIGELPDAARRAQELGYEELWLAEDCFLHGGLTAAATALALTDRLSVGVGLLPAAVRNTAIAAMELATLANLFPGRVAGAFGHGVESWMRQIGARPPDRVVALREVVGAARSLLAGETVSLQGRFVQLDAVALDEPPSEPPPLLIGTTGERGIGVAREVADGLVLPEGSGPAAVAWASEQLGGRGRIVVYAWMRVDEDGARARAQLVPVVRAFVDRGSGMYASLIRLGELGEEIDDAAIGRVAIAGTAAECADAVRRLGEAGAATVVVQPVGDDGDAQLERFAADVAPLLAG